MLGAPEIRWPKLLTLVSLLILSYLLQSWLQNRLGWSFDFVLILLVASTFFISLLELFFVSAVAALILTWQPGFSWEILIIFILPIAVYGARKVFSGENWIFNVIFALLALILFYLVIGWGNILSNWLLMLNILLGGVIFAVIAFFLLEYIYGSD